ncbi:MAG TPA: signal protein PDZ [Elusimicrobia bacterium]|nr:signal protein PDZ [Elusimicrobiota bacterium]
MQKINMKKNLLSLIVMLTLTAGLSAATVNHALEINIEPQNHSLSVKDTLTFSDSGTEFVFTIHQGLTPSVKTKGAVLELMAPEAAKEKYGISYSSSGLIPDIYRVTLAKKAETFRLEYGGFINHPLGEQAEEYSRSFSETPGIISGEGCYLSAASGWYPHFENALVTFTVKTSLPAPYDCVAGGTRINRAAATTTVTTVWEEKEPQDEITLACGQYSEYMRPGGQPAVSALSKKKRKPIEHYAFLRFPDAELAERYLDASKKYVDFYSSLIGPYPYSKFALVENFWETGYGLPSFTLLGGKIIRLPFIINSSYPHEILHNWWGNGVFTDYEKGNWCEGLTAYLADYLIAENRGKGKEYRETTLQKYADYVLEGKDFPLTEFRSRNSSASEAVGYGKTLMFYHMLRNALGDAGFKAGLKSFYNDNRFKSADFDDLKKAFEKQTGSGRLSTFFDQWIKRAGSPELVLKNIRTARIPPEYTLEFTLAQTQEGPAYELEVPAAIYLEGIPQPRRQVLKFTHKEETFNYSAPLKIMRLEIDPEFNVFRKLNPLETPPTLSRLLGAKQPGLILPDGEEYQAWEIFASAWTKDKENLPLIRKDSSVTAPPDGAYWLLGAGNRFAPTFEKQLEVYGARFSSSSVIIGNREFSRAGNTFVFASFAAANNTSRAGRAGVSSGLIISASTGSLRALASKLPHYGKYSWLVFDSAMNSAASGVWTTAHSPLAADLGGTGFVQGGVPESRAPLAVLPSVFSAERLGADISALAALPGGRGPDSAGLEKSSRLAAKSFIEAGLKPFYADGWEQGFKYTVQGKEFNFKNVVAKVEGTKEKDEYLVLCAHYDHLAPKGGEMYSGADDNASGTALLLELARYYALHPQSRTLIFAAFSGEEEGRLGSRFFMDSLEPGLKEKINAAVNFDTVGRLGSGKILLLGSGSSAKWPHIFRGAGFVTGVDYDLIKEELDSSDQASFIEKGLPAVQFFSGPKADYHKPSDTFEKIDLQGVVKQAEFAKEIIDYLASDSEFLTRPPSAQPSGRSAVQLPGVRKVSTGLIPDFSFQGKGVRAQEITPGSPLSAAGIRAGAVITKLNGETVASLKEYSAALKKFSPGETVKIDYISDNAENTIEIKLAEK